MTPTCIDLRERFSHKYRIGFAEGRNDPWMFTIPCRFGAIYPHGGEMLALELDGHSRIARKVASIPGFTLHQDGDDEKTFLFPVSLFEQVAAVVEPKRVRRLTEEQRTQLVEAGRRFRFQAGAKGGFAERQASGGPIGGQEVA
jgi:hypothetical protein